jgi:group II intron reverse transcriptase/maturase
VRQNQGSAGIDGMTVDELVPYLRDHWPGTREALLAGTYQPSAVRQHQIPKGDGRVRTLGIPAVLDRFIQQAVLQVLQPRLDPTFSESSYGFRPGRRAHDAVRRAQQYVQSGRRWVVDVDLEQFVDRVHHDVLMGKLGQRIADRRVLALIRRYLEAGVMANGVAQERHEGTPQGGPLSPLLANVLLDGVDKELERRGHCFVRYADDCNVYVRSERAGERVMQALVGLYADLRLPVNPAKSAVARAWDRSFLGFRFWVAPGRVIKRRVAPTALATMKDRIRAITSRSGGRSIAHVVTELRRYLVGWRAYFRLADTPQVFARVEQWLHRRLRALHLKHWKTLEARLDRLSRVTAAWGVSARRRDGGSIYGQLVAGGGPCGAASRPADVVFRSTWCPAACRPLTSTHRTAGCGPACPVVWEGSRRGLLSPTPYPDFTCSRCFTPFA